MKNPRVYRGKLLIYLEIMSKGKSPEELQEIMRILDDHGYDVKKRVVLIQKNIEIDKDLWDRVNAVRETNNMLIRECVHEALEMWLQCKTQPPLPLNK